MIRNIGPDEESNRESAPNLFSRRRDYNLSPLIAFYEVTRACGLVCKHCRACAQTQADPGELNSDQSRELMAQLAEFPDPPMLVLTGGDPFCRSDIFDMIEYATQIGLEVSITPSATPLVTHEAIQRLADAGIHRMAISIDAATAAGHDEVRGVFGSFHRSISILKEAQRIGLPTQINTTLTPDNIGQIDTMAYLFAELGIALWSVFFLVPVGRADQSCRLSDAECELAFEMLERQSRIQPYMIKTTEAPHYRRYLLQQQVHQKRTGGIPSERPKFVPMGVNDGKGIVFISHVGEVYPSGFMPIQCGSFPSENVVRIYQDSQVFRDLRDANKLQGKCGVCEFRNVCGGSRARAFAVTGNPLAEEPDCAYRPASESRTYA